MEDDQTDPEMVLLVLMERAFKGPTHEGVRILDWAPQLKRVLKCVRENDPMTMELRGEIERLRAELETERMRLVACSVIALANTPESAASARGMHPDYQSPYCDDVARAVDREIALRAELEECRRGAERYRTALEQIVAPFEDLNFVSGNKLLTYIHDVATAALAAKGDE